VAVSALLHWLAHSQLNELASHTRWVFAAAQAIHFMGLSVLLGAVTLLDLRILGLARNVAIARLFGLIPLALVGFGVQLITGVIMFSADPSRYWSNPGFRIKMLLIVLAGLNALWFWLLEHRRLQQLQPFTAAPPSAQVVAAISILVWILVIAFGRFLPYLDGIELRWLPSGL